MDLVEIHSTGVPSAGAAGKKVTLANDSEKKKGIGPLRHCSGWGCKFR